MKPQFIIFVWSSENNGNGKAVDIFFKTEILVSRRGKIFVLGLENMNYGKMIHPGIINNGSFTVI